VSQQDLGLVPGKEHYAARYVRGGRLFSYAHQMHATLEHEPKTVLEVGPGPGMVTAALRAIGVAVTTVDVQPELKPDVVASVTDLPFEDDAFDVAMCCQVLEHLPFEDFPKAINELYRVSRKRLIISLPDRRPHYYLRLRLPGIRKALSLGTRQINISEAQIEQAFRSAGHYWEIGFPEYPLHRLLAHFDTLPDAVVTDWRDPDFSYHHFFCLAK